MTPATFNFSVEQCDINNGIRFDGTKCAVALAIMRQNADPTMQGVHVGRKSLTLCFGDRTTTIANSSRLEQFVTKFDNDKPCKPQKFKLRRT